MSEMDTQYLDGCHLVTSPSIGLTGGNQESLVQLFPNEGNVGSGIALVRDAAGDFLSLGVYINQSLSDITQCSNLKILDYLFQRIRGETGKTIHLAAYGPFYGLDPEGRKHVLYLGKMDVAMVEFDKQEIKDVSLLDPFDTDKRGLKQQVASIASSIIKQKL